MNHLPEKNWKLFFTLLIYQVLLTSVYMSVLTVPYSTSLVNIWSLPKTIGCPKFFA